LTAVRHLGFLKCETFNGRTAQEGQRRRPAKFGRNRNTSKSASE